MRIKVSLNKTATSVSSLLSSVNFGLLNTHGLRKVLLLKNSVKFSASLPVKSGSITFLFALIIVLQLAKLFFRSPYLALPSPPKSLSADARPLPRLCSDSLPIDQTYFDQRLSYQYSTNFRYTLLFFGAPQT